jgi:hypothetical protein
MSFPEGFTVLDGSVSVQRPEPYPTDHLLTICEVCLHEEYPDIEEGMELAEEWGEVRLVDGRWAAGMTFAASPMS